MKHLFWPLFAVLVLPAVSQAGVAICTDQKDQLNRVVNASSEDRKARIRELLDLQGRWGSCMVAYFTPSPDERALWKDFIRKAESKFLKQASATSASSSGSTTLVSKGYAPRAIAFAVEQGALTQSISGNVVTIRGNLAGIPYALAGKDLFPYCDGIISNSFCLKQSTLRALRTLSFSASFDTTRNADSVTATTASGSTPATASTAAPTAEFRANRQQLAGYSFRWEPWNRRDSNSKSYQDKWKKAIADAKSSQQLQNAASALQDAFTDFVEVADQNAYLNAWKERAQKKLEATATSDIEREFQVLLDEVVEKLPPTDPGLSSKISILRSAYRVYFLESNSLIDQIANKTIFAVEYTNQRPLNQSPLHNVRGILDIPLTHGFALAANGALTWFDRIPDEVKATGRVQKLRDVQIGGQLDKTLGDFALFGPAIFSFAGYYQFQRSDAILEIKDPLNPLPGITFVRLPEGAKAILAQKGNIGILQAKIVLGPKDSGVKVPFAVSWSNRTELINKSGWKAQIGVSFDMDTLFQRR